MRTTRAGLSLLAVVSVLILAACSGPVFDPTGNYTGAISGSGSSVAVTTTIAATATQNTWDFTLSVSGSPSPYTGTCTHDPSGPAGNLSCSFASGLGVLDGTLNGNAWTGDYLVSGSAAGTFSLTRP
ncbi:MAG TPA: hypothetical protein VKA00_02685 [Trueperaceae bacterium]|nr:hypothetical protein [Trueperaceae bacterium]